MSSREKRLLIVFSIAIFAVVNFFGFNWLSAKRGAVGKQITEHKMTIDTAEFAREQAESVQDEVDWLLEHRPEPKEAELVPSELENLANGEAVKAGLTVSKRKILPADDSGVYFNRAKIEMVVSGEEKALYQWLYQLQSPDDFRAVTSLRLTPNREDDTKIDATIEVEQWYVPATAEMGEPEPETAAIEN